MAAPFERALAQMGPWSIVALLVTLILLFAFQGEAILDQPLAPGSRPSNPDRTPTVH